MEFLILNPNFETIAVIDHYVSAIWTERFNDSGDFEFYMPMDVELLEFLKADNYVLCEDSDRAMIIEDIKTETNPDEGDCLLVMGRSLEQILSRRIISTKISFEIDDNGVLPNLQNGIKKILTDNVIKPTLASRRIPNFVFKECVDTKITSLTLEAQYFGNDIFEVVSSLCQEKEIGFKIIYHSEYTIGATDVVYGAVAGDLINNAFVFELYAGVDRSYEQTENPYIVFSPENENLLSGNYCKVKSGYKNVAIVAGEEEDTGKTDSDDNPITTREIVTVGNAAGLDRREIFVDANDVTYNPDEDTELTYDQYRAHLKHRGIDALIANLETEAFQGEVEGTRMYKYGEDFFIGDIVQLVDKYGNEGRSYISSFTISHDKSGIAMYPTFTTLWEGEYDYE